VTVAVSPSRAGAALEVIGLSVAFGGVVALADVSLSVAPASITGLVGPNGAGKTTAFGVISGLVHPDAGRVVLDGVDVTGAPAHMRARRGLGRTFQHPQVFSGLSVRDHVILGDRVRHHRARMWSDAFLAGGLRRQPADERERVDDLLGLLGISELASRPVDGLPLGTSRLVEIARALATAPSVLLLDEPFSGLSGAETDAVVSALRRAVGERGVALLLVEHDVPTVLALSSTVHVLDFGRLIASGTPAEIRDDARVRAAYLGDALV